MRRGLVLGAFFLSAGAAFATLTFEATELTLKPESGEKKLSGEFVFTNTGDAPVTVTDVSASCGCTTPTPPKEAVAPGAKGVIPVGYSTDGRQGRQQQTIFVKTSDGQTHQLRLVVELPVRVSFAPRLLVFSKGGRDAKSATLTFGDDLPVTLVGVESTTPAFEVVETPRVEDAVLKVDLRFTGDSAESARGVVRIRTKGASGAEHTDLLYVRHTP